ncbi:hypothetical protein CRUP_026912 [Coryphaenoides rupestris]|nr:hypothetical protein CRUP_026912 [Coryphaenoides rupestris]
MAQTSLLQGKRFYCREWVFHKIQHCLQEKGGCGPGPAPPPPAPGPPDGAPEPPAKPGPVAVAAAAPWGVLLVGGPGSGKTAVATELLWPTSPHGARRGLHRQALAFHFCRADDAATMSAGGFVRGLVAQLTPPPPASLLPGYLEKVSEPTAQSALQPGECERNPADAFKRTEVFVFEVDLSAVRAIRPLLSIRPPQQALFLLVDSVDEGCQPGEKEHKSSSSPSSPGSPRTIAELLASHHEFLPPWLLLICSARRQNKAITKLFTGPRYVSTQFYGARIIWTRSSARVWGRFWTSCRVSEVLRASRTTFQSSEQRAGFSRSLVALRRLVASGAQRGFQRGAATTMADDVSTIQKIFIDFSARLRCTRCDVPEREVTTSTNTTSSTTTSTSTTTTTTYTFNTTSTTPTSTTNSTTTTTSNTTTMQDRPSQCPPSHKSTIDHQPTIDHRPVGQ